MFRAERIHLTSLPPLAQALANLAQILAAWEVRHRTRCHLARLSPAMLDDIGLTVDAVDSETGKPFWRD